MTGRGRSGVRKVCGRWAATGLRKRLSLPQASSSPLPFWAPLGPPRGAVPLSPLTHLPRCFIHHRAVGAVLRLPLPRPAPKTQSPGCYMEAGGTRMLGHQNSQLSLPTVVPSPGRGQGTGWGDNHDVPLQRRQSTSTAAARRRTTATGRRGSQGGLADGAWGGWRGSGGAWRGLEGTPVKSLSDDEKWKESEQGVPAGRAGCRQREGT